jgi:thioesterase domain-containing protein/acyl carrier protein
MDEQVKVRGLRIELGEVEAVVCEHEGVREAVVVTKEYGEGDVRLVGYLVPQVSGAGEGDEAQNVGRDAERLVAEVQALVKQKLPAYMIPSVLVVLESIPLTPNGKLDRRALPAPEEAGGAFQGQFIAPRDAMELQLAQVWQEVLKVPSVGVRDNFFERGGHSLLAVRVLSRIRQTMSVDLPLSVFFKQQPTVENLAAYIREQRGDAPGQFSPLVEIKRGTSGTPFFCVHPSGGNVLCYAELAQHLDAEQSFYGLQARGLEAWQAASTTIEEMAESYVEAIREVQPEGPYLLGGWSMGGLVAFEMAQQLQAQGQQVSLLALLDTMVPTPENRLGEPDELSLMANFALDMGLSIEHLQVSPDEILRLNSEQQLAYVLEMATRANVLPPDIDPSHVERLYHVFKTNVRAMLNYEPRPFPGQLTVFKAEETTAERGDAQRGWEDFTLEGVELLDVPGDHFTMVRAPHVKALAEALARCLENAMTCV